MDEKEIKKTTKNKLETKPEPRPVKQKNPKKQLTFNVEKDILNIDGLSHRAKVRYDAKLKSNTDSEVIFEGKEYTIIYKKI